MDGGWGMSMSVGCAALWDVFVDMIAVMLALCFLTVGCINPCCAGSS